MSNLKADFKRGQEFGNLRRELAVQGAFTPQHLRLKGLMIENALCAQRTGTGPSNHQLRRLMAEWLIIQEEVEGVGQ